MTAHEARSPAWSEAAMQPRQAMEHSAQRKPNRLVQMRIYCKAACRKARCRRCRAERIARLKRMRQKRDERNCRRTERHVQPREMPGNKADGAVMVLQTRRTRHRRQSNDCRAWRGQSECGASIAAKRRPAFSADSQAQHTRTARYGKAIRRQVLYSNVRAPNAASPFRASRATPSPSIPQLRLVQGRRNAAQWASRFTIPLYLQIPKCAGVKNALRPYRLA